MAFVKSETHQSSRFASLYVGDLSPDVTEKDLIDKFSVIGPVVSVHLCRDSITGESLSYAFVNFDSSLSASNAMGCFNNTVLKGKAMRIMLSQTDLSYRPRAEENGQSKGFGFVQFDTAISAVFGLHVALMRPAQRILHVLKEVGKEFLAKVRTTPKDSWMPKTYEDKAPRNNSLLVTQDVPKIDHDQKKHLRRKNSSTHRCLSLGEVCLMQEKLKQEILTKVQFLTFDDEGVLVGL